MTAEDLIDRPEIMCSWLSGRDVLAMAVAHLEGRWRDALRLADESESASMRQLLYDATYMLAALAADRARTLGEEPVDYVRRLTLECAARGEGCEDHGG